MEERTQAEKYIWTFLGGGMEILKFTLVRVHILIAVALDLYKIDLFPYRGGIRFV